MEIGRELRRQSPALVSLLVALGAVGYNTWRNERTEDNRTVRAAGFEMLVHIGRLMPAGNQMRAEALYDTWNTHWRDLGKNDEQAAAAINDLRAEVTAALAELQ